ncbi:MAG: CDP-alcohol phosphatidyltransferase family protein [Candidatus Bathyarchaeia archaeon]
MVFLLGRLREWYERTMNPAGKMLASAQVSPNLLTLLSMLVALTSGYAYSKNRPVEGALIMLLSAFIDMLDGAVARASGRVTRFGATLDHVIDRYSEAFIVTGMIVGGYLEWELGLFAIFGMVMASFTRAKAESVGGLKSCTVGVAERQEKLLLFIIGSLATSIYQPSLAYAAFLVGALSNITVIQRLHYTWNQTEGR